MQATLVKIQPLAPNIKTFWFKAPRKPDYVAGQFIELLLPHNNADNRGQKHWFTLSSSPSEELLAITTKRASNRGSTFKQTLFSLKPGASVIVSEPMGDFVLPIDTAIPLLLVVGGLGVTPVRSMIKWLSDTNEQRDIQIIYSVREHTDAIFLDLFEHSGAKTEIILSHPAQEWTGRTGPLNADIILEHVADRAKTLVYVSGPEPMVEKLETELLAAGILPEKLVLDFFPGYPIP